MVVRTETPDPAGDEQSLGELVAQATKDASQLLRYELDLAKAELKSDAKRVGMAAGLAGVAAFVLCLVIVLLCIAFAFGLITLGIWTWAAFLIVAGTCVALALLAVGIAYLALKHLSGLRDTRKSVSESLGALRGGDHQTQPQLGTAAERPSISRDGQQAEIAAAREAR